MFGRLFTDPKRVKRESEAIVIASGGRICEWLPHIERTPLRNLRQTADRALCLNAVIQIAFEAPIIVIRDWLVQNDLSRALSEKEQSIINNLENPLSQQQQADFVWSIEALWTLMWACGRVPALTIDSPVGNDLAGMFPNLRANESAAKFHVGLRRRSYAELYGMRDLFYRAMWYARDGSLNGYPTPGFDMDKIMERRKALEWVTDRTVDWDNTDQST